MRKIPRGAKVFGALISTAIATCLCVIVVPAWAQEQPVSDQPSATLQEVVVTGSHIRTAVPADDGPLPVQVITGNEIQAAGVQSTDEFLHDQPVFAGFATGDNNGNSESYTTYAQLNLWGLGAPYTLVLLNGVRFEADAPANFAIVPPSAIERVDVLKAGASAVYGSDAVAGVVNFVTKDSANHSEISVSYGQVSQGTAPITTVDFSTGSNGESGKFFFAASYYNREPLDALDRADVASNNFTPFGYLDFRSTYGDPAQITLPGSSTPIILNTALVPNGKYPTSPADFQPYNFSEDASAGDRPLAGVSAIGGLERESFYLSATRPMQFGGEIFVDAIFSNERVSVQDGSTALDLSTIGGVPASNPWNVFGEAITTPFLWRPLDIGGPDPEPRTGLTGDRVFINRQTGRLQMGYRRTFANGFNFQGSVGYFSLESNQQDPTSISIPGLVAALNRTGPTAFNPFCVCNTATQYAGVAVTTDQDSLYRSPSVNANLNGNIAQLPAGPIGFDVGAEYRRESSSLYADPLLQAGDIADAAPVLPYDLKRSEEAGYTEVRVPLLPGAQPGGPSRLDVGLAVRYEHYSDFGSATKPLYSIRWDAIPSQVLVRASLSDSFRAPYLEQITSSPSSTTGVLEENGQTVEAVIIQSGNPHLKPETAKTIETGLVFTPSFIPRFRVALDFFDVKQDNVIVSPSPQLVLTGQQPGTVIQNSPTSVTVYTPLANIASRSMRAGSVDLAYIVRLPGSWSADVDWTTTYLFDFLADIGDGTGRNQYAGRYSQEFGGLPKTRSTLNASVSNGPLTGGIRVWYVGHYYDDYTNWSYASELPPMLPIYWTTDLNLTYDLSREVQGSSPWAGLKFEAGVKNVFNKQAPFVAGDLAYDYSVADLYGRFYHAGFSFRF